MASVIQICNVALGRLGNSRVIASLTERAKKRRYARCFMKTAAMQCWLISRGGSQQSAWRSLIWISNSLIGNSATATRWTACALLRSSLQTVSALLRQNGACRMKLVLMRWHRPLDID